jgi:hypothetical protein
MPADETWIIDICDRLLGEPVKRRPGRPKATETPATPRQRTSKAAAIPAIDALLAMLPAAGQTWNAERRAAWFALAQHVLRP